MFTTPYLGTVTVFAGTYAPLNWHFCDGSLLPISNNETLFTLIGTTYGGDGVSTFALPDLQGRYAIHPGQGLGLPPYSLGQKAGTEAATILSSNLPAHTHVFVTPPVVNIAACSTTGNQDSPVGNVPASCGGRYSSSTPDVVMAATAYTASTTVMGASQPVNNISPYLAMNYIICTTGLFPSRN